MTPLGYDFTPKREHHVESVGIAYQQVRTDDARLLRLPDLVGGEIRRQIQCHEVLDIRVDFLQLGLVS